MVCANNFVLKTLESQDESVMPSSGFPFIGMRLCPVGKILVSWHVTSEGQIRHNCA